MLFLLWHAKLSPVKESLMKKHLPPHQLAIWVFYFNVLFSLFHVWMEANLCRYTAIQTIHRDTCLMRLAWIHKLDVQQSTKHFRSSTIWEMVRREHELVEQADSVQPHPAGDSSGMPKYALWDQPSKPLTHCDSLPFFSPAVQLHILPASRTFCLPLRSSTMQCCFPCCTCDRGLEKYWHLHSTRSVPKTFVSWCYMFVHALLSGSVAKEERDSGSELHGAGQDLGHSQDFLMGSGCSLTHDANISIQSLRNWIEKQPNPK